MCDSPYGVMGGAKSSMICACAGFIGGGENNFLGTSSGYKTSWSLIVGGRANCINDNYYSAIVGGEMNTIDLVSNDGHSFIGGGGKNAILNDATYSSILGGYGNTVPSGGYCNIHIIGSNITATTSNYTFVNNICCAGGGLSDRRLKSNICAIPYTLCQISSLNPVSFTFNHDSSQTTKYGFLAQEVQEILPELVSDHPYEMIEGSPALRLEKDAILMGSISAIKEIKNELDDIKKTLDQIKQIQMNLSVINKQLGIDPNQFNDGGVVADPGPKEV
jgi:hypothetical protein